MAQPNVRQDGEVEPGEQHDLDALNQEILNNLPELPDLEGPDFPIPDFSSYYGMTNPNDAMFPQSDMTNPNNTMFHQSDNYATIPSTEPLFHAQMGGSFSQDRSFDAPVNSTQAQQDDDEDDDEDLDFDFKDPGEMDPPNLQPARFNDDEGPNYQDPPPDDTGSLQEKKRDLLILRSSNSLAKARLANLKTELKVLNGFVGMQTDAQGKCKDDYEALVLAKRAGQTVIKEVMKISKTAVVKLQMNPDKLRNLLNRPWRLRAKWEAAPYYAEKAGSADLDDGDDDSASDEESLSEPTDSEDDEDSMDEKYGVADQKRTIRNKYKEDDNDRKFVADDDDEEEAFEGSESEVEEEEASAGSESEAEAESPPRAEDDK